jgi:hypothetical protein
MSAPTAISGPIERAGGVSAARLQPFSRGVCALRGAAEIAARLCALPWRSLVLDAHVCGIDTGQKRACSAVAEK